VMLDLAGADQAVDLVRRDVQPLRELFDGQHCIRFFLPARRFAVLAARFLTVAA
jgi:hypothetical protein